MDNRLGLNWIKMAAVYLLVGVLLGIHMGKSHDFQLAPVHAHLNLLGWATMAIMGLLHSVFPRQLNTRLAQIQFWLHQVGTPVMLVSLALFLKGNTAAEPVLGVASLVVGVSVVLFLVNVLRNLRASQSGS